MRKKLLIGIAKLNQATAKNSQKSKKNQERKKEVNK
jgi:hypothetical protein